MIKEKYLKQIKQKINQLQDIKNLKVFIFGSGLKNDRFGDIDLGLLGKIKENDINKLKEEFEESNFPYDIDVINFNNVNKSFKDNVMDNKVLWIKR